MIPLIELRGVNKSFHGKNILKDLNLKIYPNEIFGLVGKSGSGKTTLMRILIGFYKVDSGKIFYKGEDFTDKIRELRTIVGFATQENSFYQKLTVEENLIYYSRLYGIDAGEAKDRITQLVKALELELYVNTVAQKLSGGTKKRLDLAISLIHNPEILILDEPTTGLDPILRRKLWDLIKLINKIGKSIIFSSHLFDEIESNCTRVGVLSKGDMKRVDFMANLKHEFQTRDFVKIFEHLVGEEKQT